MTRILEGRVKWRVAGDYCENVFHWINSDDGVNDFVIASRLYNAMVDISTSPTGWLPRLRQCCSSQAFISTISTRVIKPVGGNRFANQFTADDITGSIDEPIYTDEVAMVINWLSLTEPTKMGRVYLPAVPTTFVDGGRWESAAVTGGNNFANEHVSGISNSGSDFNPVIYRSSDFSYREISDGYLSPNVGQQSRRGMGE